MTIPPAPPAPPIDIWADWDWSESESDDDEKATSEDAAP